MKKSSKKRKASKNILSEEEVEELCERLESKRHDLDCEIARKLESSANLAFILYILRFSHQILLCEKAFRILLRPIREAKRVSHTCKNRFVQSQTTD